MTQIIDFSCDENKVRLLIADTDVDERVFNDAAITAFLALATNNSVKRAAALALRTMAANEVMVQKRIKLLNLSTDGPAEAKALRELAADLETSAANDEAADGGAFGWAEQILSPAQLDEYRNRQNLDAY